MGHSLSDSQEIILINDDYYSSLIRDIQAAKKTIDLEVYIFDADRLGQRIAKTLIAAAQRGVKIRILVDSIGTASWGGPLTQAIESAGIATRAFHPLPFFMAHWYRAAHSPKPLVQKLIYLATRINSRNHRKTCIIDSRIVYVSSANISMCHINKAHGGQGWRETTVKYTDINTNNIQYAFENAWNSVSFPLKFSKSFLQISHDPIFQFNFSLYLRIQLYRSLLKKLASAKSRIWLINAYFIPPRRLLKILFKQAKNNVDIKIILSRQSDVPLISLVSNTFYLKLIKKGIHIYEFIPENLHQKIIAIDDWYTVGTANLNHRSFKHDLEINAVLQTQHAKNFLEAHIMQDLNQSKQIKQTDLKNYPFWKSMLGNFLLFFKYYF